MGLPVVDQEFFHNRNSKGANKLPQFIQEILGIFFLVGPGIGTHQQGALDHLVTAFDFEHSGRG